jgi:glycosyltransferase involved in cell wall biosynthesis
LNKLLIIVSGNKNSPMAIRGTHFAENLQGTWDIKIAYRIKSKFCALLENIKILFTYWPDKVLILDCHASGVFAGIVYFLFTGKGYVLDTGDAVYELGKNIGRTRISLLLTFILEQLSYKFANRVIVRGRKHRELVGWKKKSTAWIPDGVDVRDFNPKIKKKYARGEKLVLGLIGSLNWNQKTNSCYGMDLIEIIKILKDSLNIPICGIIIGDGSGLCKLVQKARDLGIEHDLEFPGRIDYSELPTWITKFNIALSSQSNDLAGQVRTTGKLPLYLASGCFVIASNVGEAANFLPRKMLLDTFGTPDNDYPRRVSLRIIELLQEGEDFNFIDGVDIARKFFDYKILSCYLKKALIFKHNKV